MTTTAPMPSTKPKPPAPPAVKAPPPPVAAPPHDPLLAPPSGTASRADEYTDVSDAFSGGGRLTVLRLVQGQSARVALPMPQMAFRWVHRMKEQRLREVVRKGYVRCHSSGPNDVPWCCRAFGRATPRGAIFVVRYGTHGDGRLKEPFAWEVMPWVLDGKKIGVLQTIRDAFREDYPDALPVDLLVKCTDEQFQAMEVTADPRGQCLWLQNEEVKQAAWDAFLTMRDKVNLFNLVCRDVTEAEMRDYIVAASGSMAAPGGASAPQRTTVAVGAEPPQFPADDVVDDIPF